MDILDDINKLEIKKDDLNELLTKSKTYENTLLYNEVFDEYSQLKRSEDGKKALELKTNKNFIDTFNYNYYNLDIMNFGIIEDISTKINSNNYKYYAVDKNYNIIHSYTTDELIKFTKEFSKNPYYPITIIEYIIFSKTHQKNNINI
jgi:hypothetical protein